MVESDTMEVDFDKEANEIKINLKSSGENKTPKEETQE
jgi:hypothetical protein